MIADPRTHKASPPMPVGVAHAGNYIVIAKICVAVATTAAIVFQSRTCMWITTPARRPASLTRCVVHLGILVGTSIPKPQSTCPAPVGTTAETARSQVRRLKQPLDCCHGGQQSSWFNLFRLLATAEVRIRLVVSPRFEKGTPSF